MKTCTNCNETKSLDQFSKHKKNKDGLETQCKVCLYAKNKLYKIANAQSENERNKKWREANKNRIATNAKLYRQNNYEKLKARKKGWFESNREYVTKKNRAAQLKYNYGITEDQYNEMLLKQENSCAICGTHSATFTKRLAVDHCHETGKIRGLLCTDCNTTLGKMNDNPCLLEKAATYLRDHGKL